MSYLLDKKIKKKKLVYVLLSVFILFILFYFRSSVFNGLAFVSHVIFRPVLVVGNSLGEKLGNLSSYFSSKNSLYKENKNLKFQLDENNAKMSNYDSILAENISLKEILGRLPAVAGKDEKAKMILSAILSKPNQSPYDTLIIDAGVKQGLQTGNMVFGMGNVPIGVIAEIYPNSSKVVLFSSSGEKTQAVVSGGDIFIDVVGRGGGNFEIILPRDFTPIKGDEVVLPGITPYVLGVVETIISDPRDPFIKALLTSPVNIQELKFVEVKIN